MPQEINTTGDRGLDREIDALWKEIRTLKSTAETLKTSAVNPPSKPVPFSLSMFRVREVDGSPDILGNAIEFDQADGFSVTDNNGAARIDWLPAFFDFARLTSSEVLIGNPAKVYQRVIEDAGTARTLTLPNPAVHLLPIFLRVLTAPALGHTVARNGAESIDSVAANLTMGTVAGQLQSVLLISDGTNWYSLMRVLA